MTTWLLESNRRFGVFMTVVTLESSHESNRRWIVWWVVRATCHNVIAGRRRTRFLERAGNRFSGYAGNASRPHTKCVPAHRFRMGRTPETGLYPGWMAWISALCTFVGILMHAVKTEPARCWAGFRVVCCLFCRFPLGQKRALRGLSGVLITDVSGNVKTFPW